MMKLYKLLPHSLFFIPLLLNGQSGIIWSTTTNISSMTMFGNQHPRVVLDRSGDPMVLWGNTTTNNAYFSKWNGASFTTPVVVNTGVPVFAASWAGPDIASHGDTVYIVVKETPEVTNFAYCYSSFDGGVTFSSPTQIDINLSDSISRVPTVSTDNIGNPIVGYMKINPDFSAARWVVTKSNDFGSTYNIDKKASGWSGGDVCDCCPATITSSGNTVSIMYRDNNANIRDMWAGFSTDNANSFTSGAPLDNSNWMLMFCPSTGPDGVIIGDKLYSVLMSGYTGDFLNYFSQSSISTFTNDTIYPLTGLLPGLTTQNYPRIATDGSAVGIVWKQVVSGQDQLPLLFTNNINNGFPVQYDTVDLGDVANADIAILNGAIHIVWEDPTSGTVKYRKGSYTSVLSTDDIDAHNSLQIYPNPANSSMNVQLKNNFTGYIEVVVTDVLGKVIQRKSVNMNNGMANLDISTLAVGSYILEVVVADRSFNSKFIKQ